MAFGRFGSGSAMFSTTPVENMFILEFMPAAPGDFVRVYLYGLMQCHHPEMTEGVADVARALNLEEETVLNACRYWEREGLIVRLSDNPPTFEYRSCREALDSRPQIDRDYYENRDFTASLQNLFGADMLLHPKEYTQVSDWMEVMHLPQDVILCMVKHELGRTTKKRSLTTIFKYLDKTAIELADCNIRTAEDAEAYLKRDEEVLQCARAVIDLFNFGRAPTKMELELTKKWMREWNFDSDAILAVCRTVRGGKPSFGYLDKMLEALRTPDGTRTDENTVQERMGSDKQEHEQIKQLLSEMKVQGLPSQSDKECFRRIMAGGFEFGVLLQAARTGGKKNMEDLETLMFKWAEQNIYTMEQYDRFRQKRAMLDRPVRALFDRAGIERNPRQADRDLMEKWQQIFGMDMILLAGERSRGTDTPMRYIDATLMRWQKAGIMTPEAAEKEQRPTVQPKTETLREAGNFMQREYKEEDFAHGFFVEFDPDEEETP